MGLCGDSCVRRGKLLGREPSNREGVGTGRILADREGLWGGGQFSCRAMGKGQSLGKGAGFGKKSVADGGMASQVFLHPPLQSLRTTARSCAGYTPLPRRTLRPSASRAAPTYPHPHTPHPNNPTSCPVPPMRDSHSDALCSILRKALDKIAEIKSLLEERRIGTCFHCAAMSQTPCVPDSYLSLDIPCAQPTQTLCL